VSAEHLSSADVAWLHMDRPTNLLVINSVLVFDERLDWERLTDVVRTRLVDAYPRFRQRVLDSLLVPGGPRWVEDPHFDLARHIHRRGLPAPAQESALRELIGDLASTPLDRNKPLWDMYLIDGPAQGSAVIVRMHHCIADGIALAQVLLSLTDAAPGKARHGEPPANGGLAISSEPAAASARGGAGVRALAGIPLALVREGVEILTRPRRALELADVLVADARELVKLLLIPRDSSSLLELGDGAVRCVAWSEPLSLEQVKMIAHAQGATVNDVLLAALSGALRGYLSARGEEPHALRTLVPFNLRDHDRPVARELGNEFGLVFLELPVDRSSRRERLRELKRGMDGLKSSPEGQMTYVLLEAMGLAPAQVESRVLDIFSAKASAVTTNVPGPRQIMYLAGSPLRTVLVWAPTAGSVGMSVSIFSYNGKITVGVLTHTQQVPDPQAIVDRLQRELTAMLRLAPAGYRGAA
jgi:WS/DGAT/MGAT family acyltransferase